MLSMFDDPPPPTSLEKASPKMVTSSHSLNTGVRGMEQMNTKEMFLNDRGVPSSRNYCCDVQVGSSKGTAGCDF